MKTLAHALVVALTLVTSSASAATITLDVGITAGRVFGGYPSVGAQLSGPLISIGLPAGSVGSAVLRHDLIVRAGDVLSPTLVTSNNSGVTTPLAPILFMPFATVSVLLQPYTVPTPTAPGQSIIVPWVGTLTCDGGGSFDGAGAERLRFRCVPGLVIGAARYEFDSLTAARLTTYELTVTTPEPSTLALLAGPILLATRLRRRSR